jgi:hypothetical protein
MSNWFAFFVYRQHIFFCFQFQTQESGRTCQTGLPFLFTVSTYFLFSVSNPGIRAYMSNWFAVFCLPSSFLAFAANQERSIFPNVM